MDHKMSLYAYGFEQIKSGKKTREYRLNDEKRCKLNIGDTITFFKLPDQTESIITKIIGLRQYTDWQSCYKDYFEEDLKEHYESIEAAVQDTYKNWWSKDKEEKYGCLIIEIEKINI